MSCILSSDVYRLWFGHSGQLFHVRRRARPCQHNMFVLFLLAGCYRTVAARYLEFGNERSGRAACLFSAVVLMSRARESCPRPLLSILIIRSSARAIAREAAKLDPTCVAPRSITHVQLATISVGWLSNNAAVQHLTVHRYISVH